VPAPSFVLKAATALGGTARALDRGCARTRVRVALFAALALLAIWPQLATAGALVDFRDAQYNTLFEEAARIAVARFHELPLWNPYYCGGLPALATPSARFVSPTFLLSLVFGTLRADALVAFFMTIAGLEGAFRYARAHGASSSGAFLGAPIFALSGLFATAPTLGWMNFFGFELIPWVALGARHALRGSVRGAVLGAVAIAWIVGHGGTYAAPLAMLLCIFEGVAALARDLREPSRLLRIVGMSLLFSILGLGLAAVRLWPIGELLASSPRMLGSAPGNDAKTIATSLFGESVSGIGRGGLLVGVLCIPVALTGLLLGGASGRRRWIPLLVAAALWVWLAAGSSPPVSAFVGLRAVPPFTMLRYPERFLVLFALALVGLSGIAIGRLETLARKRPWARLGWFLAVILLGANTGLLVGNEVAAARGRSLLPPPPQAARDFKQARGNRWLADEYPGISRGSLSCFDDYQVPQSKLLRGDLAQEEYLRSPDDGTVVRRAWSPNEIDLHASLTHPARLFVNQNWHPGWRSSVGTVAQEDGLLAVDLPAGENDVRLRFRSRAALGGLAVTVAALVAAALLWRRSKAGKTLETPKEWGLAAAIAIAPLVLGLTVRALEVEPSIPPPPLVAPNGEPILAEAPPDDARNLGVRFAEGVTLQASRLRIETLSADTRTLTVELDWKLAQRASSGMGVFVHILPSKGDSLNADHTLLSTVVPFEAAPVGVTLRDITVPITLPATTEPRTWTVRAGLWMDRRGGERIPVIDKGSADAADNRVLVGSFETP
jgi:hypothetical protein